jgi:hypothetical protein
MTCDICNKEEKEIGQPRGVTQNPLVLCHELTCGHRWHRQYPSTGDLQHHRECDCADYARRPN